MMVRESLGERLMRAVGRAHPGQAIVLGALVMTVLVAFTGLAVDVGVWLVAKSRLQRAVDAAALSVILDRPVVNDTNDNAAPNRPATNKAQAIILSQGINGVELLEVKTGIPHTAPPNPKPRSNQFWVSAKQRVPTAFARVIGISSADISAKATSDINSFIEIPVNPICISGVNAICDGMIGDSTMDAFGTARPPRFGDPYENPTGPWYNDANGEPVLKEKGYPYRIHIEKNYTGTLVVQGWDIDGFNRNNPHKCRRPNNTEYTPAGSPPGACDVGDTVISDWNSLSSTGQINPQWNDPNYGDFPAVISNAYGAGWHKFYRIDECNNEGNDYPCYDTRAQTPLQFTFWSLSPSALDPWNPLPGERTDLAKVTVCAKDSHADTVLAGCTITYECLRPWGDQATCIDMVWVELFRLDVATLPAGPDGSRSLYVDVKPIMYQNDTTKTGPVNATKGENAYNLRSGPPPQGAGAPIGHATQTQSCQGPGRFSDGRSQMQHVNNQAACQWESGQSGANTNTKVFARRSFPFNVVAAGQATPYRVYLGWIPKAAAGQTLRLRNYDLDSSSWNGTTCNAAHQVVYKAYFPSSGRNAIPVTNFCGSGGAHDSGTPGVTPNLVEDWSEFKYTVLPLSNTFWDDGAGNTEPGFWLYGEVWQKGSATSPFWDTGVYEVLFDRARLIS